MRYLSAHLACEGRTDALFLPTLLQRGLEQLCTECAKAPVDVPEVQTLEVEGGPRFEAVCRAAARATDGMVVLMYHYDGTADTGREAAKYWQPMRDAWASMGIDRPMVPVVPVRETEAWALADHEQLRRVAGAAREDAAVFEWELLQENVEHLSDPKRTLSEVIAHGRKARRPKKQSEDHLPLLAERVSLDELRSLPSVQLWWQDCSTVLEEIGFWQ